MKILELNFKINLYKSFTINIFTSNKVFYLFIIIDHLNVIEKIYLRF